MTTTVVRNRRAVRGAGGRAWFRAVARRVRSRSFAGRVRGLGEQGMTTAEYAVGTMAAVAFAGLLLVVVRSGPVKSALSQLIVSALGTGS